MSWSILQKKKNLLQKWVKLGLSFHSEKQTGGGIKHRLLFKRINKAGWVVFWVWEVTDLLGISKKFTVGETKKQMVRYSSMTVLQASLSPHIITQHECVWKGDKRSFTLLKTMKRSNGKTSTDSIHQSVQIQILPQLSRGDCWLQRSPFVLLPRKKKKKQPSPSLSAVELRNSNTLN